MCTKTVEVPFSKLPEIVYAGLQPTDSEGCQFRSNNEKLYCLNVHIDAALLKINSRSYNIAPGDITCFPSESGIQLFSRSEGHHWTFRFSLPVLNGEETFHIPYIIEMKGQHKPVLQECTRIAAGFNAPYADIKEATLNHSISSSRFYSFLMRTARLSRGQVKKSDMVLHGMLESLEGTLGGKVSIPEIAEAAGVSQTYLSTIFRQRYGLTINQYLHKRRIDLAKELLVRTNLPVSFIGDEIGMADPQYFNKQFRKSTGMSPTGYRQKHR